MSGHNLKKNPPSPSQQEVDAFAAAAGKGDAAAVAAFLDKYADAADLKNSAGRTALTFAAYMGSQETVALLLARGARVNEKDGSGWTPAMYVAACGETELLALLLDKGAAIEGGADKVEWTPLMLAASSGYADTVRLLIDRGAPINTRDCLGKTALDLARGNSHSETVELLCRRMALKDLASEASARETAATRLEKLKSLRPPKTPFRKDGP